jgi:hypothetical protein
MEWLINYYYDHGQQGNAMKVAKHGAEVYSSAGLNAILNLLVRMEKVAEAEEYGKKIQERYNDSGPLITFYQMMAFKGDLGFKAKLAAAIKQVFPSGLQPVMPSSFEGPPMEGIQFAETNKTLALAGLSSKQVVVALDGYRVQNVEQYTTVRSFSKASKMVFIIWNGHVSQEVTAYQPGRRFGVNILSYAQ